MSTEFDRPFWESDVTRPAWPPYEGDVEVDLCVVGLGGSGLAAILQATQLGLSVVGIDAGRIAGQAAGLNGGLILAGTADAYHEAVARVGRECAARMYQATLDEMARTVELIPELVSITGVLRLEDTEEGLADCEVQLSALHADGFSAHRYEGRQGQGLLIDTDGSFHPVARALVFAQMAVAQGARLYEHTPALTVTSHAVTTPHGVIRARHIIVATDGYLTRVLPETAAHVRQVRLQMIATAPQSEVMFDYPGYAHFGYDYWQQRPNGAVVIGGGRHTVRDFEYTDNMISTEPVRDYLQARLSRLGVSAPITHAWAGIVTYTDSGQPFVGQVQPDVYGLGGFCGTGNIVGTLLGRELVNLIVEGHSATANDFGYQSLI
ncbi:MAG: FAD-binding oxidoreductase [Actinomycetes bacterium]